MRNCIDELSEKDVFNVLCEEILCEKRKLTKLRINPALLHDFWKDFLQKCSKITEDAVVVAKSMEEVVRAGDLFVQYLNAFSGCMRKFFCNERGEVDESLETSFIWNTWIKSAQEKDEMFELLNNTSIAQISILFQYEKYEKLLENKIEKIGEKTKSKLESMFSDLLRRYAQRYSKIWEELEESLYFYHRDGIATIKDRIESKISIMKDNYKIMFMELFTELNNSITFKCTNKLSKEMMRAKSIYMESLSRMYSEENAEKHLYQVLAQVSSNINHFLKVEVDSELENAALGIERKIKESITKEIHSLLDTLGVKFKFSR